MQGDGYRYSFQGQEHDDEVKGDGNSVNYKFRMHDPRVGRFFAVDPLAEKYAAVSPYVYCLGNPIKYNDLDGRWVPGADKDNNVLLTKEEGDTKKSLAKFMGNEYSKKEINKLWKSRNKGTGVIDLTKQVGGVFQEMKTAMTESQARNNPINTDYDVVPNRLGGKNMTNNYNCWGTCIALNDGKKLETGVGINTGAEFDTKLSTGYSPTTQDVATVGKTVVRYADVSNVVQHGAIFMGVDNSGNGYLFSKNGWAVQPEIHTTDYIKNFVSDYGTIKGINAGETGYYNKK
jgi:RHS repeat-associated protein